MSATDTGEMRQQRVRPGEHTPAHDDARPAADHRGPVERRDDTSSRRTGYDTARMLTLGAWASAVITLFIWPVVFGLLGIGLGIAGYRKGDPSGRTAAIVAGVAMLAAFVVGLIFAAGT